MESDAARLMAELRRRRREAMLAGAVAAVPVVAPVTAAAWALASGAGWASKRPDALLGALLLIAIGGIVSLVVVRAPSLATIALRLDCLAGSAEVILSAFETVARDDAVALLLRREALRHLALVRARGLAAPLRLGPLAFGTILAIGIAGAGRDLVAWRFADARRADGRATLGVAPIAAPAAGLPAADQASEADESRVARSSPTSPVTTPSASAASLASASARSSTEPTGDSGAEHGELSAGERPLAANDAEAVAGARTDDAERASAPGETLAGRGKESPRRGDGGSTPVAARQRGDSRAGAGSAASTGAPVTAGRGDEAAGGAAATTAMAGDDSPFAAAELPARSGAAAGAVRSAGGEYPREFGAYLRAYLSAVRQQERRR